MVKALAKELVQAFLFLARYTLYFGGFIYAISSGFIGFFVGIAVIYVGFLVGIYAEEIE